MHYAGCDAEETKHRFCLVKWRLFILTADLITYTKRTQNELSPFTHTQTNSEETAAVASFQRHAGG